MSVFRVLVLTASLGVCGLVAAEPNRTLFNAQLYVQLDLDDVTVENRAQRLADMRAAGADALELAICEFFATGERRAVTLAKLKDMLAYFESAGYPVLVWTSSLGYGEPKNADYERRFPHRRKLTSLGGTQAVMCATDPDYSAALEENTRDFIRAGAKFILWDDDFVQACRPGASCVCAEHLRLYSQRVGRPVTVEDVRQAFTGGSNDVRTAFVDVMGETLETLARRLRRAADELDPSVGMGLCASYTHYGLDGGNVDRLIRIFRGRQQPRPFLRLSGAPYWAGPKWPPAHRKARNLTLGGVIEFARMQIGRFRGTDVFLTDENDPYPRRSDKVPAALCEVYDQAMIAEGNVIRNKYMLRYGRDRVDTAYLDAHLTNRAEAARVADLFCGAKPVGFRVYSPDDQIKAAHFPTPFMGEHDLKETTSFPLAGFFLARQGVPTQYSRDDTPVAAFGAAVLAVPRSAYRQGLLLDRTAAEELARRGVDVGPHPSTAFSLYRNKQGETFAVVEKNAVDLPFDEIWTFLAGPNEPLPCWVPGNRGVYPLVKERADGSLAVLLANVNGEPTGEFTVRVRGQNLTCSLQGWGTKTLTVPRK